MFLEWLIASAFLWVPTLLIVLFVATALIESENGLGVTALFVATLLLLQFGTSLDPLGWVAEHPVLTLVSIVAYFFVGVIGAHLKWRLFVSDKMEKLGEATLTAKTYYATQLADPARQADARRKVRDMAMQETFGKTIDLPLQVSKSKARIMRWMAYWPLVAIHFLLWDSMKRAYEIAYRSIAKSLQRYSDAAYDAHKAKFSQD